MCRSEHDPGSLTASAQRDLRSENGRLKLALMEALGPTPLTWDRMRALRKFLGTNAVRESMYSVGVRFDTPDVGVPDVDVGTSVGTKPDPTE